MVFLVGVGCAGFAVVALGFSTIGSAAAVFFSGSLLVSAAVAAVVSAVVVISEVSVVVFAVVVVVSTVVVVASVVTVMVVVVLTSAVLLSSGSLPQAEKASTSMASIPAITPVFQILFLLVFICHSSLYLVQVNHRFYPYCTCSEFFCQICNCRFREFGIM